jgi:hypothetical protein
MNAPPIYARWEGDVWRPLPRFAKLADQHFVIGEDYPLVVEEERSEVTHRHEFAWLREAWRNLPEHLADEYPTAEHLRKRALIATGYCTVTDHVCASRAEAQRTAAFARAELDDYAVVIIRDNVVRVARAKSQSRRAMKAPEFQASKTAILEWVAGLLQVSSEQLQKAEAA